MHENFLSLEIEKLLLTLDDLLEKKACEQIYSETENYYRINIITKEKNKKYIINIFKYYARLLDYDISINSLAPIYSDFNELI